MPGVEISIIDHVTPMLRSMVTRLTDFSTPLKQAGQYMQKQTVRQFETEGARSGDTWPPLSPRTVKARRKGRHKGLGIKMLQDTGLLRRSVTGSSGQGSIYELTATSLRLGTNLGYAAIHQHGGTINRTVKPGSRILVGSRKTPTGLKFAKTREMLRATSGRGKKFRYVSWAGGKLYSVHIPQRKFLVVTDDDAQAMADIFLRYATKRRT